MNKIFTLSFILFFTFSSIGQNFKKKVPDFTLIEKNISNKNSKLYYPKLLARLKANDTLITEDEYHHLYYGYALQKEYNPYKLTAKHRDVLNKEYAVFNAGINDPTAIQNGITLLKETLNEFPLDITAMTYLSALYNLSNQKEKQLKISKNIIGILDAIIASGDGLSCDTAFKTIYETHEYMFFNLLQMQHDEFAARYEAVTDCNEHGFYKDNDKTNKRYYFFSKDIISKRELEIIKSYPKN